MVKVVRQEDLEKLLHEEIKAWQVVAGGVELDAYEFDPKTVNISDLKKKGFFKNREAWIAGVCINKIKAFLKDNDMNIV